MVNAENRGVGRGVRGGVSYGECVGKAGLRWGANDGGEERVDGGFKRGGGLEFVLETTSIDEDVWVGIREEKK